jgi:hypothetical protein
LVAGLFRTDGGPLELSAADDVWRTRKGIVPSSIAAKSPFGSQREGRMAMVFMSAVVTGSSIAAALFGGLVPAGAPSAEVLSLAMAASAGLAVASAAALDS